MGNAASVEQPTSLETASQEEILNLARQISETQKELLAALEAKSEFTDEDIETNIEEITKVVEGTQAHNINVKEVLEGLGVSEITVAVEVLKTLQTHFITNMAASSSDDTLNRVNTESEQIIFGVQQYYIHFKNFSIGESERSPEMLRAEKRMLEERLCSLIHFLAEQDPSITKTEAYKWSQGVICGPLRASKEVEEEVRKAEDAIESYGQILQRRFVRTKRTITEWVTDYWKKRRETTLVRWTLWLWKHRVILLFIAVLTKQVYIGFSTGNITIEPDLFQFVTMVGYTLCLTFADPLFVWKTAGFIAGRLTNLWIRINLATSPLGTAADVVDSVVESGTKHFGSAIFGRIGTWLLQLLIGMSCTIQRRVGLSLTYVYNMVTEAEQTGHFPWSTIANDAYEYGKQKANYYVLGPVSEVGNTKLREVADGIYERYVSYTETRNFWTALEKALPVPNLFKKFLIVNTGSGGPRPPKEILYLQPWVTELGSSIASIGPQLVSATFNSLQWLLEKVNNGWNWLTYILYSLYHVGMFLSEMYHIGKLPSENTNTDSAQLGKRKHNIAGKLSKLRKIRKTLAQE